MIKKVKTMEQAVLEKPKVKDAIGDLKNLLKETAEKVQPGLSEECLLVLLEYLRELKKLQERSNYVAQQIHTLLAEKEDT